MGKRVLVIDDEEGVRDAFVLALGSSGHNVTTAPGGRAGIEEFKQRRFDLVYLDLRMPEMSGVEVLRELRGLNSLVPIYIVTAFPCDFADGLKRAAEDGLKFELLRKPFGVESIQSITQTLLGPQGRYS